MDKEKIKLLCVFGIVFVTLFVGIHFLLVSPNAEALDKQKEKLKESLVEMKKSQGLVKNKNKLKTEIDSYKQTSKEHHKRMISPAEFDSFRNMIRDMGAEYDVKVIQDRTELHDDSKKIAFADNPSYTEKVTRLRLSCKYHNFGSFLNRIENTSPYHQVTSFDIIRTSFSDKEYLLDVNMEIVSLLTEVPA